MEYKYNYKIELNTYKDIVEFVNIMTSLAPAQRVYVTSDKLVGNAKSLLNMMATVEWDNLVCRSDYDIYTLIKKWIKG